MVTQAPDGSMVFRFYRPDACQVFLAGDFNGWQKTCMPMVKGEDGWWSYRLGLSPGIYQFRYIADGQWHTDYAAFGLEHGPFGWNSVVKVDAVRPRPTVRPSIRPERVRDEEGDVLSHVLGEQRDRNSRERQRPVRVPAVVD